MKSDKKYYVCSIICCLCLLFFLGSLGFSAELWNKDSVVTQVSLKAEELQGFTLRKQWKYEQEWISKDDGKELLITLTAFHSPEEAIIGTSALAGGASAMFSYGSFSGAIIGNHSWINSTFNADMYFVKDNVGVFVALLKNSESDKTKVEEIARLIVNKINQTLPIEVKDRIAQARNTQISDRDFHTIIKGIPLSGYSMVTQGDAFWALDTNILTLGRREELQDTAGNTVVVDIAKFNSNELAEQAGKDRAKFAISATWLDDVSKPIATISKLRLKFLNNSDSIVFKKGKYVIHIYYHSETESVDTSLFFRLVPAIANNIAE